MQVISLSSIDVRGRQRKHIASGPLVELATSILNVGLLHPPVCWQDTSIDPPRWVLSVGERRLKAIQSLTAAKEQFRHGDQLIPLGSIPITPLGDYLDAIGRFEAELDENIHRVELDWRDRIKALSDLHDMRLKANPQQTMIETGRELASKGQAASAKAGSVKLAEARIIAAHMDNETIKNARSADEALGLIYKAQEEKALATLAKRQIQSMDVSDKPSLEVRHADCTIELKVLEPGTFDLILADPPYGIDAGSAGFRARTVHHHNYADTPDAARAIAECILAEGFRVTKARANIFIFCDIDYFDWLKRQAAICGWVPFRRPLIWMKSESEGLAPWGGQGPRITTEFIFYATKGQRGLHTSPIDVFNVKRVSRSDRLHAAEKPVELLKTLISCSTLPGDTVLDPCCGSGSTLVAAKELRRRALGIERDETYFNTALANVHSGGNIVSGSNEPASVET